MSTNDLRAAHRARCARVVRDGLGVLAPKWSVAVLLALGEGSRRYHELLAELDPISEKVLTQTLRTMERDGLIAREVHPEVPPRVDYELTPLGAWGVQHAGQVEAARERYDARGTRSVAA